MIPNIYSFETETHLHVVSFSYRMCQVIFISCIMSLRENNAPIDVGIILWDYLNICNPILCSTNFLMARFLYQHHLCTVLMFIALVA